MKIASWNVSCYRLRKDISYEFSYEKEDFEYFWKTIKRVNPDILCLQENYSNSKMSFSEKIAKKCNFKDYFDAGGTTSYFNKNYKDTNSVLSKNKITNKTKIKTINPKWEHTFNDGYHGTSYDEWFQVVETFGITLANVHFLPEKTFEKNYAKGIGNEYFTKNLNLLEPYSIDFLVGDFNTTSLNEMTKKFVAKKNLVNAFKGVGTRPTPKGAAAIDAIFYSKIYKAKNKTLVETKNDHYMIVADFDI